MSRTFFATELEGVAIYWRVERRDGLALGFTTHDRDLRFDGLLYSSAPGMVPSAIKLGAGFEADTAEVRGALSSDAITEDDLVEGRYDGAYIEVGLVDWETLERATLYSGDIGPLSIQGNAFECELKSLKSVLEQDLVPRTSPACRAQFCGPGCGLSAPRYTHEVALADYDPASSRLRFQGGPSPEALMWGSVRWIDGPHAGSFAPILDATEEGLLLDMTLSSNLLPGTRLSVREGCDHTFATCADRFANSINFQGEPFLPGNDALLRYPTSSN